MKIRVITGKYGYMGLEKDSVHDVGGVVVNSWGSREYRFNHMGRGWALTDVDCEEVFPAPNEKLLDVINTDLKQQGQQCPQGPIKSDGGSSSYYDLPVSEWLLHTLNDRQKEGRCYIKTEEMIQVFFGNDFSVGNMFKATVRGYQSMKGAGKNDLSYEVKKIQYYANRMLQHAQQGDGVGT